MKRFPLLAAAIFAMSIVAGGCAKEKAPSQSARADRGVVVEAKGLKTSRMVDAKWFSGTIQAMDTAAGTLTLKGPKGTRNFRADEGAKKDLAGKKIGDKVIVKHTGEVARSIVKPGVNSNHHATREKENPPSEVGLFPESK